MPEALNVDMTKMPTDGRLIMVDSPTWGTLLMKRHENVTEVVVDNDILFRGHVFRVRDDGDLMDVETEIEHPSSFESIEEALQRDEAVVLSTVN